MLVTEEQRRALWETGEDPVRGHRIVSARAGTGKTSMLAEYCSDLARQWARQYAPWQGAAVLSFTNVATREIDARVRVDPDSRSLTSTPHFLGTIDRFLNQQLFLPFGATEMPYRGRPKLVGYPVGPWKPPEGLPDTPSGAYAPRWFDCYAATATGKWIRVDKERRQINAHRSQEPPDSDPGKIDKLKRWIWSQGYATQADANYLSLQVLRASARLTDALINRFPVLIIDEAQDMTEVQHAVIDHLAESGLGHIVLVGDPYQAIYEWNTARPGLFVDKVGSSRWETATLSSTFRCSPAICAALTGMTGDDQPVRPAPDARNSTYEAPIAVIGFPKDHALHQVGTAIDRMAEYLSGRAAHRSTSPGPTIAVLGRLTADVAAMYQHVTQSWSQAPKPTSRPVKRINWNYTHTSQFLKIISERIGGNIVAAIDGYEDLMLALHHCSTRPELQRELAAQWGTHESDLIAYRTRIFADLNGIANTLSTASDPTVGECAQITTLPMHGVPPAVLRQIGADMRSRPDVLLVQQFSTPKPVSVDARLMSHHRYPNVSVLFSTIHGVKGETYDGVVFYAKEPKRKCECKQNPSSQWREILSHSMIECESKRLAYVALSRAAQALYLIVPEKDDTAWRALEINRTHHPTLFD